MLQEFPSLTLDDGQVIQGKFGDLTQYQLISLANQLLRASNERDWRLVMQYQHAKFHQSPPIKPTPIAA